MLTSDTDILEKTNPSLAQQLFKTAVLVVVMVAFVAGILNWWVGR
ncbi:MAG: hypothetical protein ACE5FJ_10665 [Gemmatimonadales bacterium]